MGTRNPLVHIEAATLAGGDNNQDRYAYGDGWAFVLDGASSFSEQPSPHDGGWYAERLRVAMSQRLMRREKFMSLPELIADAIAETASRHDVAVQGPCPSSTIALARWDHNSLEAYVLGDSIIGYCDLDGCHVIRDNRLSEIGDANRLKYQDWLRCGNGFDSTHEEILRDLQRDQMKARNRQGGYWIASDDPLAAAKAIEQSLSMSSLRRLVMFTDGCASVDPIERIVCSLEGNSSLEYLLNSIHESENFDADGKNFPRSKPHDDKTVIRLVWRDETSTPHQRD